MKRDKDEVQRWPSACAAKETVLRVSSFATVSVLPRISERSTVNHINHCKEVYLQNQSARYKGIYTKLRGEARSRNGVNLIQQPIRINGKELQERDPSVAERSQSTLNPASPVTILSKRHKLPRYPFTQDIFAWSPCEERSPRNITQQNRQESR